MPDCLNIHVCFHFDKLCMACNIFYCREKPVWSVIKNKDRLACLFHMDLTDVCMWLTTASSIENDDEREEFVVKEYVSENTEAIFFQLGLHRLQILPEMMSSSAGDCDK